ncbi:glycosyltransferase family A protein [uncultured Parolsenella sp.]|uniref:glycosyltransferase family 2 protein n=1 Tax=uncultured Parolsenella sp. TaxID=2083008 RepID=UPI0025D500EF|nr:glycosyltransferase family A protein [uncultured Parolsenella sp.]
MPQFCVFTPTYNRAYCLPRLFESLVAQTSKDFEWLVVDDGSDDDTESLIQSFIDVSPFAIKYLAVENGGKQRAMNLAASIAAEPMFMCVDSDDWLDPKAIETFSAYWEREKGDASLAGLVCPRAIVKNGHLASSPMMPHIARCNAWDLYEKYHYSGDALHVYRTELMREYPSPVADGEKFISEGYYIHSIAKSYDLVIVPEALQFGEYLPDGYTSHARELAVRNPIGYLKNKALAIEMSKSITGKINNTLLYLVGCELAGKKDGVSAAPIPSLAMLCFIPSKLIRLLFFR